MHSLKLLALLLLSFFFMGFPLVSPVLLARFDFSELLPSVRSRSPPSSPRWIFLFFRGQVFVFLFDSRLVFQRPLFKINTCARFVFSVAACCVNRLIDTFQRDWFQLLTFSPIQCQTQIPTACAAADWIPSVLWFEFFSWFVLCFSGLEPFHPFLDVRADRLVHLVYLFILFCWYAIGNWKEKSRPSCVISHFSPNTTAGLCCSG